MADDVMEGSASPAARAPKMIGETLSGRHNSLNFLRLVFASMVVLSHAGGLAKAGDFWTATVNQTSVAQVSLYGFFGISGYLIAQSVMRTTTWEYLKRRVLRIFPGLIVCLLVTAFVFGVIAWYHYPHPWRCSLSCYFHAPDGPVSYVYKNTLLANPFWTQHTIAGAPRGPFPFSDWNGSIWSLFFEFVCYLILLGLALVGFLRHRLLLLVSTAVLWLSVIVITVTPAFSRHFSFFQHSWIESLLRFAEIFFVASCLYVYRDKIRDSGWIALGCAAVWAVGVAWPLGGRVPTFQFTPSDLVVPLLAYPVLWLGAHLPFTRVGSKNDYSYGIYIYGWPITSLFVMWHEQHHWAPVFELLCLLVTVPFAVGSWWLVEKRALALKAVTRRERAGDFAVQPVLSPSPQEGTG